MKIFGIVSTLVLSILIPLTSAEASDAPRVVSFDFTPKDVEITTVDPTVNFELVVQHPLGIEGSSTLVTLSGPGNTTLALYLNRTNKFGVFDSDPVNYKGSLVLPRNISEGAYFVSAKPLSNFNSKGYQYSTGEITPVRFRNLVGAENALIVRFSGDANIDIPMFAGPTYDSLTSINFKDTSKYNRLKQPIFRVGETFDPTLYFESYVPSMPLNISTSTPNVCSTEKALMKFVSTGNCQFKIFTNKTKDYASKSINQSVDILPSRIKSTFVVNEISVQQAKDLPKTINLPLVYSAASGYVLPISITPSVCLTAAFSVRIISGGICTLTYQTAETAEFLASDIYKQNIEITRDVQSIIFAPPTYVELRDKVLNLTATASSGGPVQFSASPTSICKSEGNLLTLLKSGPCVVTASQAGTTTISPISISQTISITGNKPKRASTICVRKGMQVEVPRTKCPKGFKRVA